MRRNALALGCQLVLATCALGVRCNICSRRLRCANQSALGLHSCATRVSHAVDVLRVPDMMLSRACYFLVAAGCASASSAAESSSSRGVGEGAE
eukprot:2683114-Alexandrium_andersonii.AAC.1